MHFFRGESDPAASFFQRSLYMGEVGELMEIGISLLLFKQREINAPCIDAYRCSCLHAVGPEPKVAQLLGHAEGCRFSDTTAAYLHRANMYQPVQEGAVCEDHGFGGERHAHAC